MRDNFSPALYSARTAEQRAQTLQRIFGDFGDIEIVSIAIADREARIGVRGASGMNATFVFGFDGSPEQRIDRVNVQVGGPTGGPNVPPAPVTPAMSATEMSAAINDWITPFVAQDDFAGAILVARDGLPYVSLAYGPAHRAPAQPADIDTAYNIASLGKRFTQTAVARLIQDGRLSLSTTVGDVIPDYPQVEGRAATVEQLITMRGGIADIFSPERESRDRASFASNHDYYEFVSSLPQRFTPGSREEYCNGCYVLLGEMISRITGMPFEQYVQRTVFDPAGMRRTGYFHTERLPVNAATPYMRPSHGADYVETTDQEGVAGNGAGGLYSTVSDLLAFDNALRDRRLLDAQWTGWVLDGPAMSGRNTSTLNIKGGGPGASASYASNGRWSVFVFSNVQRPLPFQIADTIAAPLTR